MRNYFLITLLFLSGCINNNKYKKENLLLQVHSSNLEVQKLINNLSYPINSIIKSNLGLSEDYDFKFYLPKREQRITETRWIGYYRDFHRGFHRGRAPVLCGYAGISPCQ